MRIALLTKALADSAQANLPSLARYLAGRGHLVTVIAGDSAGPCLAGISGVTLRRTPSWARSNQAYPFCVAALAELSSICTPDVLLTAGDSVGLPLIAALYGRVARTPDRRPPRLVHFMTRLDPDASLATGRQVSPHIARLSRTIMSAGLRCTDLVAVFGDDMRERLEARFPRVTRSGRVQVLRPWAAPPAAAPIHRRELPVARELSLDNHFVVLHHGGFHRGHDVAGLAAAIELTSTDRRIVWVMTHDGPTAEQLRKHHSTGHLHNVKFLPPDTKLSREQIAALADVQVISQSEHLTGLVGPQHVPELMSWGKTIISLAPERATSSRILRDHHAGCAVPAGHGEILARTIWQLHDSALQRAVFGRSARYTFEKVLCADVVLPRLERMLIDGLQT